MATLGTDCQIILTHPSLNLGAGVGFMLADNTAVAAQRSALELTPGTYNETTKLFASIVCDDYHELPNGARDTRTRAQVYAALIAYLAKRSGLTVATPVGVYTGMFCVAHLATESHFPGYSVIVATFNSLNAAFAPPSLLAYNDSKWVDPGTYTGAMTWGTSIWRSL
jgi:hypothetical protein